LIPSTGIATAFGAGRSARENRADDNLDTDSIVGPISRPSGADVPVPTGNMRRRRTSGGDQLSSLRPFATESGDVPERLDIVRVIRDVKVRKFSSNAWPFELARCTYDTCASSLGTTSSPTPTS